MSARERLYLERKEKLLGLRRSRVCILNSSTTVDMTGCDIGDNYVSWQVCVCGGGGVYKCVTVCAYMCMYTWGQPISEDLHVSKLYIQTVDIFGQRGSVDLDIS